MKLFLLASLAISPLIAADHVGDVMKVSIVRHMDQHPGASLVWEPYLVQWKGKHLVCAYGVGIPGKTDMGDIMASVTTDDGATWAPPVPVFDHNLRQGSIHFGYANAILFKPSTQDLLWCFAMRCPMNYKHSEDSQLVAAYSADGGRSWTPVELAMQYTGPLIVVAGLYETVIDGRPRYLLPAHRNTLRSDPLGSRDQFILSSSSLLEWKLEAHIPQPVAGKVFLHEGNLAPGDTEGEIKLMMRTANYEKESLTTDPPRAYSSVSKDGGHTWTPAQPEPDLWNAKSKGFFGRSSTGEHIYVYNDGPASARMSLRYKVKPAGGAWSEERTFFDAGIKNSYPTLIEIAPRDYRCVWDSGTATQSRTHIHFGKLNLTRR